MALGDGAQNNQRRSNEDSYNSRFTLYNPNGKYLKFKYWAGKLAVSINVGENTAQGFRYNENIAVYLAPLKAKMLATELKSFINDKKSKAVGVVVGNGDPNTCITFYYDKDENVVIDISKVDGSGKRTASDNFAIQKDYHFAVNYNNFEKLDFEKVMYNDLELQGIIDILDEFYSASNGAAAYGMIDMSRFNYNRLKSNTEAIMDKLGIQRYSSKGNSGSSFFDGGQSSDGGHSHHADDLEDLL